MSTAKHAYPAKPPSSTRSAAASGKRMQMLQHAAREVLYPDHAPLSIMQFAASEVRILAKALIKDPSVDDVAAAIRALPAKFLDPTPPLLQGVSRKLERNNDILPRGSNLCAVHAPLNAQVIRSIIELTEGECEDHIPAILGRIHPKRSREQLGKHSMMFDMSDSLLDMLKTAEGFMATILVPQEYSKIYRRAPLDKWCEHQGCDACLLSKLAWDFTTVRAIANISWNWLLLHPYEVAGVAVSTPYFLFLRELMYAHRRCWTTAERARCDDNEFGPARELYALVQKADAAGITRKTVRFAADGVVEKELRWLRP